MYVCLQQPVCEGSTFFETQVGYRSFIASQSTMGKMSVDERSPVDVDGRVLERVKLLGHLKIGQIFFCCGAIKDNT